MAVRSCTAAVAAGLALLAVAACSINTAPPVVATTPAQPTTVVTTPAPPPSVVVQP